MALLLPEVCVGCDYELEEKDSSGLPKFKCETDECPLSEKKETKKCQTS